MPGACPRSFVLLPLSLDIRGILGDLHPSQDSEKDAQPPLDITPQLKVLLLLLLNSVATGELGNPPLSQGSEAIPGKPPTNWSLVINLCCQWTRLGAVTGEPSGL